MSLFDTFFKLILKLDTLLPNLSSLNFSSHETQSLAAMKKGCNADFVLILLMIIGS